MQHHQSGLAAFGWSNHFQSQLSGDANHKLQPVRVCAVHRSGLDVIAPDFDRHIPPFIDADGQEQATVGDWLLLERETGRAAFLLKRKSLLARRAAGTGRARQLIAANVDTMFIVSSCNQDFNIARLERYLAIAREADVMPVVVLTKADLAEDTSSYVNAARRVMPGLLVECINALNEIDVSQLRPWCAGGQTVVLLGSSGVGKSTLINTLLANQIQATGTIREDDAKGRHTTTGRALFQLGTGGWLIDTPGMRELQIADADSGLDAVFSDIVSLAAQCRFSDCRHETEPGCAVRKAIADGVLDEDRLRRLRKLEAENRFNAQSLAEARAHARQLGKRYRQAQKEKRER